MSEITEWQQDTEGLVLRYMEDPRPDLKDLIMVQYTGMVERIARKFSGMEPIEDLTQVGFIGLLNALSKFDPQAGVRFNTYATYLVAGEIKHYLRDRTQTIRHPAWLQELRHKVNRTTGLLQQTLGRLPTEREIADKLGVSEQSVVEVFQTQDMLRVGSLDQAQNSDDDQTTEVEKLDAAAFCPEQLSVEDRVVLEHAMKQLRDLEREVLSLFHFHSMKQTEIASKLDISCNYVSHILRQSLTKLRKILTSEEEKDRKLRREDMDYDLIDAGTGAYTETYFNQRLQEEVHRAVSGEGHIAMVVVRFEGLASLRKFYGEASVVDFMADAADFFRSNIRRLDVLALHGDTGFAILLPGTGVAAELVRQRLLDKANRWMTNRFAAGGIDMKIGQAACPTNGRTVKALFKAALEDENKDMIEMKKAA